MDSTNIPMYFIQFIQLRKLIFYNQVENLYIYRLHLIFLLFFITAYYIMPIFYSQTPILLKSRFRFFLNGDVLRRDDVAIIFSFQKIKLQNESNILQNCDARFRHACIIRLITCFSNVLMRLLEQNGRLLNKQTIFFL